MLLLIAINREFGRAFSLLSGSVMEADHPVSNLLVTGAQATGFPIHDHDQSMAHYGQLPPLHHTVATPNPPSSVLIGVPLNIITLPGLALFLVLEKALSNTQMMNLVLKKLSLCPLVSVRMFKINKAAID